MRWKNKPPQSNWGEFGPDNQRGRMNYPQYRKQGLPITSTLIESTIKQINRRVKGTEKFWDHGIEPMLALVADHLSQQNTTLNTPCQAA